MNHQFKMLISLVAIFLISFVACKKEKLGPEAENGKTMFWVASDLGCGIISVVINGTTRTITGYSPTEPACGNTHAATFDLPAGTYNYTASCAGLSWNGSITVNAGGCTKLQLTGTSGGGTGTTGQAMFWIASDLGCGNITVNIGGVSRTVTGYNASAPACGATGAATFSLASGTYSYSASCTGLTWNGSITVTAGGCTKLQLTGTSGGGTTTTGQAMLWIASDLGCGNITVNIGGTSRTISGYSATAPACGAGGAATFSLSPGTYSYSASCTGLSWNGTITVSAGGCTKLQLTNNSGGGGTTGQALFWTASDLGCGSITVRIGTATRTINSYYSSGAPACGASGAASFSLAPGTYSYSASCSGLTWNGTITVTSNGCTKLQLTNNSGGGGTTGQAMFWTASDLRCGSINVKIGTTTRTINSYYSSGAPACGASGAANFSLAPGTYNYSASCSGLTWNGTITVSAGACSKRQLIR